MTGRDDDEKMTGPVTRLSDLVLVCSKSALAQTVRSLLSTHTHRERKIADKRNERPIIYFQR